MGSAVVRALGPGDRLADTYEVVAQIGRGGMGTVYSARHLRLPGKLVAIKVLHQPGRDPVSAARYRREAHVIARLTHPNIVQVLDFDTLEDGSPFLVLELLAGESLARRLERGRLAPDDAFAIIRQVAAALDAAHRAQIIHRDLKPDNVFLCPPEEEGSTVRVKLLDFGVSKLQGAQTLSSGESVIVGTPQYMAPEQAAGRNQELDARTDVYGLGVLAFELLSGSRPFDGDSLAQLVYRVVHEAPPSLGKLVPDAPAAWCRAVDQALAKDPSLRPASVAAFIEALGQPPLRTTSQQALATPRPDEEIGFDRTVSSRERAPLAGRARWRTTRLLRAFVTSVAVVALVGLGFLGSRSLRRERTEPPSPQAPPPVNRGGARAGEARSAAAPTPPGADELERTPTRQRGAQSDEAPPVARRIPDELAAGLRAAEAMLEANEPLDALREAQRLLQRERRWEVYALMVRAYCQNGDVGGARAQLQRIPRSELRKLVQACAAFDIHLDIHVD